MNACTHNLQELSTYLDGEATPQQEQQIREQLAHCPHCQQAQLAMSQLRSGLRQHQPPPLQLSARDLLRKHEAGFGYPPLRLGQELVTPWLRLLPTMALLGLWLAFSHDDAGVFCFWLGYVALGGFLSFSAWSRARFWTASTTADNPGGRPGTLDHALEPLWTTLWLASAGLCSISLSTHSWPAQWPHREHLLGGALLLWCFPLLGACLPRRFHVLLLWLGLTVLLAYAPGLCLTLAGLGSLALLVASRKQLRFRYSSTLGLLELTGVGLAVQLYRFYNLGYDDTALAWTSASNPIRQLQSQIGVVPWLLAGWWLLVRTPLASAFELLQPTRWRRVVGGTVGLGLGLVVCILLSSETQHCFPLVALQNLPICLLGGTLLGLLFSWNAHLPSLAPQRLLCLRSRAMVGGSLLLLTLGWLGWALQRNFPRLPEPNVALISFQRPPSPTLPAWLGGSHPFLCGYDRKRTAAPRLDRKSFALARKQFLDNYKQFELHPDHKLDHYVAECLAALGEDLQIAGQPQQAAEYYLQAQRWNPGSYGENFLELLRDAEVSAPTYRNIVRCWQAVPDQADSLVMLDRDYSQWQSNLAGAPLPGFYRDFESRVCGNYYARFRAAVDSYQKGAQMDLPDPTKWSAQYRCAPLSNDFTHRLKDSFLWRQRLRTRGPLIVLVAALHLYQLEHGAYPERLEDLQAYLPTLPKNYLSSDGKFSYRLEGKNFELSVPRDPGITGTAEKYALPAFRSQR